MQFPSDIGFSSAEPASNAPAYVSESQSLKTIAASTGTQRWEFSLTTVNLQEKDFRRVWAFLNSLSGQAKTFNIAMPVLSKPLGIVSGTVQALTAYSKGDNSISFTNYLPEIGDFIKFVGHSKTYQILDTAGNSATIYPNLFADVTLSELVNVQDVLFKARLSSKLSKLKITTKKITKIKFKVIEAF